MRSNLLPVCLESLIATSSLLGVELEDRNSISSGQDMNLWDDLAQESAQPLRSASQRDLFLVAPLDILVSEHQGQKQFHLLELNGTGIGGVTNMPHAPLASMLRSLTETSQNFDDPNGVVLLGVSGKESEKQPRLNRLAHEKVLFVDAMRQGLERKFGQAYARSLGQLANDSQRARTPGPMVVPGYMKDLMRALHLNHDGTLSLYGRPVMGAVNDRFCRNLMQWFDEGIDLTQFKTLNRCFAAGSDKGVAYDLMNEYIQAHPHKALPNHVLFEHAHTREELIELVQVWLQRGRQVVIKPHGTGLGHGIEFFFNPAESCDNIVNQIDRSLEQTAEYYGITGGALPYTLCEYIDACQIRSPRHPLCGHKFELRVVVYRHGDELRAMPSIAKIARETDDANHTNRRGLINNITASGDTGKVCGTDYILPLCNEETMELLDLSAAEMLDLCEVATGYVRHVVDQVQDQPRRFGLPGAPATSSEPVLAKAA